MAKKWIRIYGDYPDLMGVPVEIRRKAMPRILKHGKEIAQQEAPKKRGLSSRKSIASRIGTFTERDEAVGHIRANAPHSHLIEFGTKSHSLASGSGKSKKQPGKAMKIYGSEDVIRRGAFHGGSSANPFMQRTEEKLPDVVDKELFEIGTKALNDCVRKVDDLADMFG